MCKEAVVVRGTAESLQTTVGVLALTVTDKRSHCMVLSREVTLFDLHFNTMSLTDKLKKRPGGKVKLRIKKIPKRLLQQSR